MIRLKKIFIQRLLNQKSKQQHNAQSEKADKLLFLFAVREKQELDFYQSVIKVLEKHGIPYDILIFAAEEMLRRIPVHYTNHQVIEKTDLTVLEVPKKEIELKLERQEYKAVINMYNDYLPVLDFVAATIPSKVRITRFKESEVPAYNFRWELNEDNDIPKFIEHTLDFVNKIR